jgi:hypothetical protein
VELAGGGTAIEFPVDFGPSAIHTTIPCAHFVLQGGQIRYAAASEVLAGEHSDFDSA